jgi:hypothetical protein
MFFIFVKILEMKKLLTLGVLSLSFLLLTGCVDTEISEEEVMEPVAEEVVAPVYEEVLEEPVIEEELEETMDVEIEEMEEVEEIEEEVE